MRISCSAAPIAGHGPPFVKLHPSTSRAIRTVSQRHDQRNVIGATGKTHAGGKQDVSPTERFIQELEAVEDRSDRESDRLAAVALHDELTSLRQQVCH